MPSWQWAGIEGFQVDMDDADDPTIEQAVAARVSGSYYRRVDLEPEDRVDPSHIGDEPEAFDVAGVAVLHVTDDDGFHPDEFEFYRVIYADAETERWTVHDPAVEVRHEDVPPSKQAARE